MQEVQELKVQFHSITHNKIAFFKDMTTFVVFFSSLLYGYFIIEYIIFIGWHILFYT